ncbi:MAG: TlyA family RNA methyltransferase [Bacillota bacterium]
MRLDNYLHFIGLARSRTHAQNLIKQGRVTINGDLCLKSATEITENDKLDLLEGDDFASLGGAKLKKAIDNFQIDVKGYNCIDIGASNGGFTDVLLQSGANKVYAVDVGECALPKEMREDERVIVKERLNARYINFEDIGLKVDLVVIDVSFISLKLILPSIIQFLNFDSGVVALIKPQFELGKSALSKKGIVQSKKLEQKAVEDIVGFSEGLGLKVVGVTEAPHPFKEKNQEYLVYAKLL